MKKKHLWIFGFVLLAFLLASSCITISNKVPKITYRGKFLDDRSMWPPFIKKHYGIDYYTAPGTPIIAASDGIVVEIVNRDITMHDF
jgi:hypothetical protein